MYSVHGKQTELIAHSLFKSPNAIKYWSAASPSVAAKASKYVGPSQKKQRTNSSNNNNNKKGKASSKDDDFEDDEEITNIKDEANQYM